MKKWILLIIMFLVSIDYSLSVAGDISLGKVKSANCAKCHGVQGISDNPAIPNLAGQRYTYLYSQMIDFRSGLHRHGNMKEQLGPLSQDEIDGLATYFSSLTPSLGKEGDPGLASRGKIKYNICQSCHGPNGLGQGSDPRLAGQHSTYIIAQLKAFKYGVRQHPVMSIFVDDLNEDDFKSLAEYISGFK